MELFFYVVHLLYFSIATKSALMHITASKLKVFHLESLKYLLSGYLQSVCAFFLAQRLFNDTMTHFYQHRT